jgi:hypothetical protein
MESDANASGPDGDAVATSSDGGLAYWGPAVAVSLAMFIGVIDSTLMNVAIPSIVVDLDTTVTVVQGAISFSAVALLVLFVLLVSTLLPDGRPGTDS